MCADEMIQKGMWYVSDDNSMLISRFTDNVMYVVKIPDFGIAEKIPWKIAGNCQKYKALLFNQKYGITLNIFRLAMAHHEELAADMDLELYTFEFPQASRCFIPRMDRALEDTDSDYSSLASSD